MKKGRYTWDPGFGVPGDSFGISREFMVMNPARPQLILTAYQKRKGYLGRMMSLGEVTVT